MQLYRYEGTRKGAGGFRGSVSYWPNELCNKFLYLKPRPTIPELRKALNPYGLRYDRVYYGYVRDHEKPGYMKYDRKEFDRQQEDEAEERRRFMKRIIESRTKQMT